MKKPLFLGVLLCMLSAMLHAQSGAQFSLKKFKQIPGEYRRRDSLVNTSGRVKIIRIGNMMKAGWTPPNPGTYFSAVE